MPGKSPASQSRVHSAAKRSTSSRDGPSATGDLAPVAVILFLQPPGGERRVGLAELGERDAGAVGVAERGHRFGQEQQAVRRARAVLVVLVILEEVRRRLARLAVVEERAAEQVAAEADPLVARMLLQEQRQLLLRLGIVTRFPQAVAVAVLVVAG